MNSRSLKSWEAFIAIAIMLCFSGIAINDKLPYLGSILLRAGLGFGAISGFIGGCKLVLEAANGITRKSKQEDIRLKYPQKIIAMIIAAALFSASLFLIYLSVS